MSSLELPSMFRYFHRLASEPAGSWNGFYHARSEAMNFGLRFQLAFIAYAVAAMGWRSPACRFPYAETLRLLVEKMLEKEVWAYWQRHRNPPEPVERENIMYSGHLAHMLGLYEQVSGDRRYDEGFELYWDDDARWTYTHSRLAETIHQQMVANSHRAVVCEPGHVYAPCNNHAVISNLLHDQLHGTQFSRINEAWTEWFQRRMLFSSKSRFRGVIRAAYLEGQDLALPVTLNFLDAWGLLFMRPYAPELVESLYGRLRNRMRPSGEGLRLPAPPFTAQMEICNTALNSGFAFVLAREMGDDPTADGIRQFAQERLAPQTTQGEQWFAAEPAPYVTALFALGAAIEPGALAAWGAGAYAWESTQNPSVDISEPCSIVISDARWDSDSQTLRFAASPMRRTLGDVVAGPFPKGARLVEGGADLMNLEPDQAGQIHVRLSAERRRCYELHAL